MKKKKKFYQNVNLDTIQTKENKEITNKTVFILLSLIFVSLYWDFFFKNLLSADLISSFYPTAIFNRSYFINNFDLPFWNPYINCGTSNLSPQFIFNLMYVVFVFPFSIGNSYAIAIGLITLFGGVFAYLFFKSLKLNKASAAVSAIMFMMAASMVSYIYPGHIGKPIVPSLIPLWMLFINKGFDTKKIKYFIFAGFVTGSIYLAHTQIAIFALFLFISYFIVKTIWVYKDTKDASIFLKGIYFGVVLGITAVLVSFIQLQEQFYFMNYTSRGKALIPSESWKFATSWSEHPIELLTYLVPSIFGFIDQTYLGWKPFVQTIDYLGYITIFISVIGLVVYWRKREIKYIAFFTLFTLLFGMGKHFKIFYKFFYDYVPFINKLRVPSGIYLITFFGIIYLFYYGFNALINVNKDNNIKKKVIYIIISGLVVLLLLTIFVNSTSYENLLKNNLGRRVNLKMLYERYPTQAGTYIKNMLSKSSSLAIKDLKFIWFIYLAFLGLFYLLLKNKIKLKLFIILTAIILFIDLYNTDKKFIKTTDNYNQVKQETDVIRELKKYQKEGDKFRICPLPASINNESNKWIMFGIESAYGYYTVS